MELEAHALIVPAIDAAAHGCDAGAHNYSSPELGSGLLQPQMGRQIARLISRF